MRGAARYGFPVSRAQSPKRVLPSKPQRVSRRVVTLGYPDAEALDIIGPLEVFSETTRWLRANGITAEPA
jgi:hypothetical protein